MKRWIGMFAVLLFTQAASAAGQSVYQELACRSNDPFVFCTQGCKDEDKNWTPIDPISGTWVAVPGYCPWPTSTGPCCVGNVCFNVWTQTAVTAVGQYMSICPQAKKQGQWKGKQRPEKVPFDH
ncbi:hypothetical protein GUF72_07820 [Xanthomonas citri pv. citri]|uniref:Secreted protein n=6 Tax=Gammaproteobacteria TaxID=1236 RepID=A0AAI8EUD4_XANAC|nr:MULTISPECIES: hypothetical protein [Xanthomonas]OZI86773.1 hypothetical protein CFN58_08935 [Pseudomonas avellanae]CEJ48465.1 conserved exported hypothetical protein [Xanthomonas citri pv. bilvae]AAM38880.1 hypothetical protein XAC4045 [Xanthomonas citri pv. citri str. 306]APR09387.1 hypothetical protein BI314_03450 [Xanthomonas citri pv. citri]APR15368.1 hypothetical protein BI315_11450 [Xanthomonas citri pv. citri]